MSTYGLLAIFTILTFTFFSVVPGAPSALAQCDKDNLK